MTATFLTYEDIYVKGGVNQFSGFVITFGMQVREAFHDAMQGTVMRGVAWTLGGARRGVLRNMR
jgi:hypothetical protein